MAVIEDVAPALLEQLQQDFSSRVKSNRKLQELLQLINDGKATYIQAEEFAVEMGTALSKTFENCLSSAALPDGKMYYNIAQRVVAPMLQKDHQLIAQATEQVQASLNKKAGIGLKPQTVAVDEDRIYGFVNKISEAEAFDDVAWVLGEPVVNFSQAVVDNILKANVDFQGKAGMTPKIYRKAERKCCKWCRNLAGVYDYPMVPDDVYRRHDRCRCTVDYDPGDGRRQNVHTKQWKPSANKDNGTDISSSEERIAEYEQRQRAAEKQKALEKLKRTFQAVPQDQVVDVLRKDSSEWLGSLSDTERLSIGKYTYNGTESPKLYQRINAMLRGEIQEEENLRHHTEIISGALKRSVMKSNVICYRGTSINPIQGVEAGEVVSLNQFISTSAIKSKSFDEAVSMVIYAPKGTTGAAYIEDISKYPKQREVLFDKDCEYVVLSNKNNLVELAVI